MPPASTTTATTILHVSDLHGGPPWVARAAEAALEAARAIAPDAVVVSGDLVQRADFSSQWRLAAEFLAKLPRPLLVVPGNHDIPLFNPLARLFAPFGRFRAHVSPEIEPHLHLAPSEGGGAPGAAIVGLCSPRRFLFDGGLLGAGQLARAAERFSSAAAGALRVAVVHHPLAPQRELGMLQTQVLGNRGAVRALAAAGVEVVLSGHAHFPRAHTLERVAPEGASLVLAQSGTTTSCRLRPRGGCETQALNVIRATALELTVEPWLLGPRGFAPGEPTRFPRRPRA